MEGVWDDEYEDDDPFLDYYGEAEEVPEPQRKKTKLIDGVEQPAKEPKPKRIVENPRLKLDVDRLLSEDRGLPELLKMASHIMFRPGHEIKDMQRFMALLELWSHRLFPKYTLKDFLAKCEVLGKKRPVKTHLRKIRVGLIPM